MKHIVRLFALLLLILLPFGVFAQQSGKTVVLSSDRIVNGNYFGTGGDVRVDGTINGDAYLAGGTVAVNGRINGDLLAAGGTVMVRGPVTQDVRVAGGTVTLAGDIGRNVTVGGGTVTLEKGARVRGSIVVGGGTLSLLGPTERDIMVGGGTVMIGNRVGGNAHIDAGTLTLTSGAVINGNLSYLSDSEVELEKGASVSGRINRRPSPARQDRADSPRNAITVFIWGKIVSLVAMYIIGLLFISFLPRFTEQVIETVRRDTWKSIGLGVLVLLVTPIIIIFLFATLIGIPFALAVLFGYIMILYTGKIFVALYLGRRAAGIANKKVSAAWALFIGLVLHLLITLIPVLGWIAGVFIMLWGVGALLIAKKEFYRTFRKKDLL